MNEARSGSAGQCRELLALSSNQKNVLSDRGRYRRLDTPHERHDYLVVQGHAAPADRVSKQHEVDVPPQYSDDVEVSCLHDGETGLFDE